MEREGSRDPQGLTSAGMLCCGQACSAVVRDAFLSSGMLSCGQECSAVTRNALFNQGCFPVVRNALLWSGMLCCDQGCFSVVRDALLWSGMLSCGPQLCCGPPVLPVQILLLAPFWKTHRLLRGVFMSWICFWTGIPELWLSRDVLLHLPHAGGSRMEFVGGEASVISQCSGRCLGRFSLHSACW